jgi:hypothetical protein
MKSIPIAMTWELLRRGRWRLLVGALAANALPAIILGSLRLEGGLSPREPSTIQIHYIMVQLNMLVFGAAVFAVQGKPSRLYALPVSTATIVAWHLLPAMIVMVIESALSTLALNALFGLSWPVWGPAIFLAVMLAALDAAIWLTEKSAWTVVAIALVAAAFGFWFKSRFGPLFSPPKQMWSTLTAAEVFTMAAAALVAYFVGVHAVARNRRGDRLPEIGIIAWIDRLLDPAPALGAPFSSSHAAQFWCEWRRKGWAMPAAVVLLMTFGLVIWLVFSRDPLVLIGGVVAGGGMLSLLGFVGGLLIGNCGPNDANYEMGQFLATRPMTSTNMARILLRTAGLSTLIAWAEWVVAGLVVYGILLAFQWEAKLAMDRDLNLAWWYFPATLLGPWVVAAVGASVLVTGRSKPFVVIGTALLVSWMGLLIFAKFCLTWPAREELFRDVAVAAGVVLIVLTVWLFVVARRRALITSAVVLASLIGWMALCLLAAMLGPRDQAEQFRMFATFPWQGWLVVAGLLGLVVFPFAAMPLAIAWNRNR